MNNRNLHDVINNPRFVKKTKTCWLYTGCLERNGYARVGIMGKRDSVQNLYEYKTKIN